MLFVLKIFIYFYLKIAIREKKIVCKITKTDLLTRFSIR